MTELDERLRRLEEEIFRKHRLEDKLRALRRREGELSHAMEVYIRQTAEEQADVDELTGKTLRGFLARLQKNTYRETLTREEAEAAAALAKQESAQAELEDIRTRIREMDREVRLLRRAEKEYEACLTEKRTWLREQLSGEAAAALAGQEEETKAIRDRQKEVEEAIRAGKRTETLTGEIMAELEKAENWGLWDAWGGGGLVADLAKYDHLDRASGMMDSLRGLVGDFREELDDVAFGAQIQVNVEEFLRFADVFWDGFFVDFTVLEQIRNAKWKMNELDKEIGSVMTELYGLQEQVKRELAIAEAREEALLRGNN